jgi:Aldehyde ferredoxin oxidoreductase, N-terminal domain.
LRYGYSGRIAKVDLARRSYEVEGWDEAIARTYLGGSGAATPGLRGVPGLAP